MNLVPGSYLGPYRVIEQIGFGRMASEYKAQRQGMATYVALKVVPAYFAEDSAKPDREREAAALIQLDHPGLLKVLDYGEGHGAVYVAYEYVEGSPLSDRVGTPMTVDETVRILTPIAGGLDAMHARAMVHRDVKPANILLARDGRSLLTDAGIARIADNALRVSETGEVIGTPAYMTPEQATKEQITRATDEYALAAVAYEMLTGKPPYVADTPQRVLMSHAQMPPPSARQVNSSVSPAVEAVLQRGLAKRSGDRYASCSEFVAALRDAVSAPAPKRTIVAPVPTPPVVAPAAARDLGIWPIVAAAVGGALVVAIIALGVVLATTRNRAAAVATPTRAAPTSVAIAQAAVPTPTPRPESTPTPVAQPTAPPVAAAPTKGPCQFVFGFKDLHDRMPDRVGNCVDDETHNPANGDALQHTTTHGLLVWRKADNWTAFTDGSRTWILGPGGKLYERPNDQRFSWEPNPEGLPILP